jgi:hypothetical protein
MVIGLTGKARSGKDTIAEHLRNYYFFDHYWFSKPMKDAAKIIFGWDDRHLYGDLKEIVDLRYGISPRVALQTLGTEWGRECINKDLWINRAKTEIELHENIVISDCRFNNEAEMIIAAGGLVINVIRLNTKNVASHVSESGISPRFISFDIENSGNLSELYDAVDFVFNRQNIFHKAKKTI